MIIGIILLAMGLGHAVMGFLWARERVWGWVIYDAIVAPLLIVFGILSICEVV